MHALSSLALVSVLVPLIAALAGLLRGSLQKEGGSIYTRRCNFVNLLLPKVGVSRAKQFVSALACKDKRCPFAWGNAVQ